MLEEFADRIQNAKDKQFKIFERFHIGDTVYPFWLNNFVVYGTVVDIDTVARKIICDFNGVRRQFCPEDLMLVNPAFVGNGKNGNVRTAEWKNSFKKAPALKGVEEKDADNGIKCVCKECGGEIAVSYDERSGKTDFVCTQCGKRISEDKVSKKCKEQMRKAGVQSDIDKCKKKLVSEARKKGICENFGQKQVAELCDKYGYNEQIAEFDEWCQNFDLSNLRTAKIDRGGYEFYVTLEDGSIESGWEYKEDAKDRQGELKEDGVTSRVYTRAFLEKSGKSPSEDANWHRGIVASGGDADLQTVADTLMEVAKTLVAGTEEEELSEDDEIVSLPYKTKNAIHNFIHGLADKKVKGFHRDSAWEDVQAVWKELQKVGIRPNVSVEDGGYSADGKCKTYKFDFVVKNSAGKEIPVKGQLCCFAAGTVEDPWESYDMTFQIF